MEARIWYVLLIFLFILSCAKESTSPDEVILTPPQQLNFETISFTSVRLTWKDICEDEEGYFIEKIFMGEIINSIGLLENSEDYIDEDMIPGRNYSYKVYSYYENRYSKRRIDLVNTFPVQINDLEIIIIDSVTAKLTWNEQYDDEHGFKIDKSLGLDIWESEIAVLDENTVEWIDTNYSEEYNHFYRVYPFKNEFNGEKIGISTPCQIMVVLSSFHVYSFTQSEIRIEWTTQAEMDDIDWNIIRGESVNAIWNNEVININFNPIAGSGTTNEPTEYQYVDNYPMEEGIAYYYWLECYDSLDNKRLYGPICYTLQYYECLNN